VEGWDRGNGWKEEIPDIVVLVKLLAVWNVVFVSFRFQTVLGVSCGSSGMSLRYRAHLFWLYTLNNLIHHLFRFFDDSCAVTPRARICYAINMLPVA
jgi:hypothetical protein